ncbi:hypothetical protein BDV29DRAFT_63521 [Aspergillus leporis]|uniref:S-adenosyl-L-methionine-dependent methyltransferase n=1 Tax=Aspergillus leporis TaxID=41062 RepID=A0A5N5WJP0_9EURO|nr:hypothetical protein BDV29DRAFT_63521 [Aspergillus leporis]
MGVSQISNQLSTAPEAFPDCCLAISSTLVNYLATLLPEKPGFTISVGSGSGLLEALIAHRHPKLAVEGAEVNSSVNRYIPEEDMHVVGGTWDLHSRAPQAEAWLFVYPREPKLVSKYIEMYGDQATELIVWVGPRADWADYEPCFRNSVFSGLSFPDDIGLTGYERLVVMRKEYH